MKMRIIFAVIFLWILILILNINFPAYSSEDNSNFNARQKKNRQLMIKQSDGRENIFKNSICSKQAVEIKKKSLTLQQDNQNLFEPYINLPTGSWPEAVAIGDVNSDSRNDVVMTTSFGFDEDDYKLFVFMQDTNGILRSPVKYEAGDGDSVDIGDLNNDGRNDVVTTSSSGIGVFLQDDMGGLGSMILYSTSNDPFKLRTGDFNDDGLIDVVSIGWGGQTNGYDVNVFCQNIDGTLNSPVIYTVLQEGWGDLDVGDINHDELTDIIVMGRVHDTDHIFGVLYQNDSGAFNSAVYYDLEEYALAWGLWGIAVGDINNDALEDVVVSYGGNYPNSFIAVYLQNDDGHLNYPINYQSYDCPEPVEIGDVNSDQNQDVIVAHGGWMELGVYSQNQEGSLEEEELYDIPYASHYNPHGLAIGDINSDWTHDVVIADYNYGLVILYGVPRLRHTLNISSGRGGVTDPSPGRHDYVHGTEVIITAVPDNGYIFTHWSGDVTGKVNPLTITMDSDKSIKANFIKEIAVYTLFVDSGSGGTTDPGPGIYSYKEGTEIIIYAIPKAEFRFSQWSGDVKSSDNPLTVTMKSNIALTANFVRQYNFAILSGEGGTIDPSPGIYRFDEGSEVTLAAIPDEHYKFSYWSVDFSGISNFVPNKNARNDSENLMNIMFRSNFRPLIDRIKGNFFSTENPITFIMDKDLSVTSVFIRIIYPPSNIIGQKILNRSLSQAEYINAISWQPNQNNMNINKYRIYLIEGETKSFLVELDSNTLNYWHRGVDKERKYTYMILAVNSEGREGSPAYLTVQ